jgi:hypothetical protein
MFQASFTITPTAGSVLATEFTVTNLTSGGSVEKYVWDFGLGDFIYGTVNPKKVYNYHGSYNVTLTAINFDGQTSTYSQQITAELEYRDYIRFTQIPEKFPDPGSLTDVPFKFEVVSSNPDKPLVVDLFSSNSKSIPYQYTSDRWEFLTPVWKFLDTNQKPIDKLVLESKPIYKDNIVVAVSGTGEFFYVDSSSTGDPTTNCPILLTVTLHTSGFSNPLDSSVYPYESFSNNQTVRAGVIWQVNDLSPTLLKITGNYIDNINHTQWTGVKTPVLVTAHSNRAQIIPGSVDSVSEVIFSYPATNSTGSQAPVTLTLTNLLSEQYSIDEAPLYFQSTDDKNFRAGGYIFTTITGLTSVSATSIIAQTTAYTDRVQLNNEFSYPLGFVPNTSVWVSNPEKNTLNKITLVPDPGTCNTINYFKDNGILTDGIIKQVSVPFSSSNNTFNYEMSGFSGIYSMAIDPRNYDLIAADAELDKIYRFSNTGELLNTFELSSINDYDPKKKMFEYWTWRTPAPSLSSTRFTFYRPTPLSPNPANYIVQAGGVILPPDAIDFVDEYSGVLRILVQPLKCGINFIEQKENFQAGLCSENFNEEMYFSPDIDINVIQIFNPVLPTRHISSIMYWTSASYEPSLSFPLTDNPTLSTDPNYYIVSIDGIVQRPDSYSINPTAMRIDFDELVPKNTTVNIVYLPTILPPANWIQTFTTETTAFYLTGSNSQVNYQQDPHSSFLVNIGGVLQSPETYSYNVDEQKLVFNTTLPINTPVSITQLTVPENINAVAAFTPAHVSLDKNYNIWVSLFNSVSVLKFDPDFNLLFSVAPTGVNWPARSWTVSPPEDISYQAARFSNTSRMFANSGDDTLDPYTNEFLLKPPVAETDKENNCWVTYANPLCCLLVKYSESGQPLLQIPLKQYSVPINLAVNSQNNIWVSNFHGSSYTYTPLSGSIELYNTTSGELLNTVTNISRPGHIALDRQNNLWFTHGLRRFGYFNTTSNTLCSWVIDLSGNITEFVLPSAFDVTTLEDFDEFDNKEDDELGGLAVDVYNRVWILDNTQNFAYVLTASSNFISYPIRSFKIIPDITLGYYIDINTGNTYTEEGDYYYRSAQATGDWTGNRWYQKYTNVQTITATPVSGISAPFNLSPFVNKHQIRRVNESFNAAEYYKSLALPEILNSNTVLFDKFLPAVVGTGEMTSKEDIGQITYEKTANFVLNHSDIDTCNIEQLLSLAELTNNPASDYAATYPLEIKNMLDIASVPRSQLWGMADNTPILTRSLGKEYNTQTDLLTAGTSIILKSKSDSSLSLLQVPPLSTGELIYPLTSFSGFGLKNPIIDYLFYRFEPAYTNQFIENVIDWDSPYTTQSRTASTSEDWYGDNGALETAFRYLLINNLFPK